MMNRRLLLAGMGASTLTACATTARGATEGLVPVGDGQIAYSDRGDGVAIVMFPSGGRSATDFEPVARELLQRGFRVILPEPRGVRGSSAPQQPTTFADMADDMARVIEARVGGPAVVVGHAFGGYVARMLAFRNPELVRGVVLAAHHSSRRVLQTMAGSPRTSEIGRMLATLHDHHAPREERLAVLRALFFADGSDPEPWLEGWYDPAFAANKEALAARPTDQRWVRAGTAPILDIVAADDPLRPADSAMEEVDDLGSARVTSVVIPRARHALIPEQPVAVAEVISSWVRRLP
jgi:pimeloyl-ACP methyl ester carboxylesterase